MEPLVRSDSGSCRNPVEECPSACIRRETTRHQIDAETSAAQIVDRGSHLGGDRRREQHRLHRRDNAMREVTAASPVISEIDSSVVSRNPWRREAAPFGHREHVIEAEILGQHGDLLVSSRSSARIAAPSSTSGTRYCRLEETRPARACSSCSCKTPFQDLHHDPFRSKRIMV